LLAASCSSPASKSSADASALVAIGAGLSGPKGASAEVVATGLSNVSGLAEDSRGRLWVATAAVTDTGTDALYMVAGEGEPPIKVVGDLHTPMGLLWIGGALYVSSTAGILKFSGFDGAQFAQQLTVATFHGTGIMGALVLGTDGRIRVGISAACDNCQPDSEWAAAIVSFLPDGTDARVEASGIRAPVGLAYVPGTNDLLVTMNQRDDLGDATPGDYLALVKPGDQWGFPDCYGQGGDACQGVPAPVAELDKHAAVSGVAILASSGQTTAYIAEWSTGKILKVALTSAATGYTGTATAYVTGVQGPVAIIASGSNQLLIGDWTTGTVYRVTTV
jgi:glucose/arabinose dehydrogenase